VRKGEAEDAESVCSEEITETHLCFYRERRIQGKDSGQYTAKAANCSKKEGS
jgi:hypothetical protein